MRTSTPECRNQLARTLDHEKERSNAGLKCVFS